MLRIACFMCGIATPLLFAQSTMRENPNRKEQPPQEHRPPRVIIVQQARPEHEEAESVAMGATGGQAVWSRRIDLNGSTGGWEVGIRLRDQKEGWLVTLDRDTWAVRKKERIPNP